MAQTKSEGVKSGESVSEHKARVVAAVQAHTDAQKIAARATSTRPPDGFPKPPTAQSEIPGFMQELGVTPAAPPPVESAPAPSPSNAPAPAASNGATQEPEWQKVYRERGWKGPEDAVRSYVNLEKEFFARLNEQQRQSQRPPMPSYPPPAPVAPQWVTPYPQVIPQALPQNTWVVQQLARKHGISMEDAERLLPFVHEVSEATVANAVQRVQNAYEPVLANLNRKVTRSEELMEIAQDPAMRVPRVQFEVDKVLRENPSVFQIEPQPMRWALDRALRNIAQESLGAYEIPDRSNGAYPMTPPVTAGTGAAPKGRGAGSQATPSPADLAASYFSLKTAEDKKDVLRALGVA